MIKSNQYSPAAPDAQSLLRRLHAGSPLSDDEYNYLIEGGYLPENYVMNSFGNSSIASSALNNGGMFERNAAKLSSGGLGVDFKSIVRDSLRGSLENIRANHFNHTGRSYFKRPDMYGL